MKEIVLELHSTQGQAPEWIHVLPAGTFSGDDGRGPYHTPDPQKLIESSLLTRGRPLPIDYDHGTILKAGSSAAAGWITALQARADGIWGKVEWTDAGRKAVESREYRFLFPVFQLNKDEKEKGGGTIVRILGAGLTNVPNLGQLIALNAAERSGAIGGIIQRMQSDMDAIAAMARVTPDANENSLSAEETELDARLKEALGLLPTIPTKKG